jgi:electron transfer flavoprotein alpha/beta subunit
MNIVVCVKVISRSIAFPNITVSDPYVLNPYDMYALEQVIQLGVSPHSHQAKQY